MKKTLLVAAFALVAASHAEAAPIRQLGAMPLGNMTCTIAGSTTTKLFVQIQRTSARVALRAYPYYGQTNYKTLSLRSIRGTSASYGLRRETLSLRSVGGGAYVGSGRIDGQRLTLTCVRG
jgi:hypothetical protein